MAVKPSRTPLFVVWLASTTLLACSSGGDAGTGGQGAHGGHGGAPTGGAGGAASTAPPAWDRMVTPPADADADAQRLACGYKAGSLPAETQGASHPMGAAIPVKHVLVLMQENRSFDHYFMKLPENGQADVEVAPPTFTNPDKDAMPTAPFHDTAGCFVDTNHEWDGSHEEYDDGKMDGFILANEGHGSAPPHPASDAKSGVRAMSYYDATDIPFYYWLANEFSIADHYHCSLLGPTWPNRMYLYAASSRGAIGNDITEFNVQGGACSKDADCGVDVPVGTCDASAGKCQPVGRTIFDYMEQRKLDWRVYSSGTPGWGLMFSTWLKYRADHQKTIDDYYADAAAGALPDVAFIDAHLGMEGYAQDDEHPPAMPQPGQRFVAKVVDALTKSPAWSSSALFITYDEHGGLFDHVPPPPACPPGDVDPKLGPGDTVADFDRYGIRVPMMVVSPFAKKHFVGHHVYDHTSIVRFIEARFTLPAITGRDANAEAPWEMFDFDAPPHATPPAVTVPEVDQAKLDACAKTWVP